MELPAPSRVLVSATVATALIALTLTAPAEALLGSDTSPSPAATRHADPDRRAEARAALALARAVLGGESAPPARTATSAATASALRHDAGFDASTALRELALSAHALPAAERREARAMLARPSSNQVYCAPTLCVHWSTSFLGGSAIDPTDSDGDGVPDYAETVATTVAKVQRIYAKAGYRAVLSDNGRGGSDLPDIYLEDLGAQGLYGYCTTDDSVPANGPYDVWAYCALDNDYANNQFPSNTPLENLQVTVAHEYFHAIQYAYDVAEDPWLLEATATWAEDEIFDGVDDNRQYLLAGPLGDPRSSMDLFEGGRPYGDWLFIRYLTERFTQRAGKLPVLVRRIFALADGSKGAPDLYSLQAIDKVLRRDHGTDLARAFATFSAANTRPASAYSEGDAYPKAPLWTRGELTAGRRSSGWQSTRLDHLTSATIRFDVGNGLRARGWRLRLDLDLPPTARGSAAVITTRSADGRYRTTRVRLNRAGDERVRVPFSSRDVRFVLVTLANGSRRMDCDRNTDYACQGRPQDDDLPVRIRGTVSRG